MSIQTVENILHEAERLTFSEQLTLIQRLLDGLRKNSLSQTQTDELSAQQKLKQLLAKPARRKLKSLELDTRGFRFNREEANERYSTPF